ncbi:unnamed protein product [Somion occarium]|uniref:Eukaryotic translation initiation factor 4E class I n=1 Tax=Somion occarium TaxID=3059160 RepID=A0ABP1CI93_9APHY
MASPATALPAPAAQAAKSALNTALAENDIKEGADAAPGTPPTEKNGGDVSLEPGEIQEVDMQQQAENIRTVFNDPKNFNVKHPLFSPWTLWFDSPATKGRNLPQTPMSSFPQTPLPQTPGGLAVAAQGWMEDIKRVISFDSVEEFWGLYNNIVPPSQLPQKANYYLFKEGIIPAWEDEENKNGGKWSIQLPKETFDPVLTNAENPDSPPQSLITGVIVSIRPQFYRLSIWTRTAPNMSGAEEDTKLKDRIEAIGKHFKTSVLGYGESAKLAGPLATEVEFLSHKDSEKKGKQAKKIIV